MGPAKDSLNGPRASTVSRNAAQWNSYWLGAKGSRADFMRLAVVLLLICIASPVAPAQTPQQTPASSPASGLSGQSRFGSIPAFQEEGAAILQGNIPGPAALPPAPATTLTITATFDPSLTAPEIAVINSAISFYQNSFTDAINVTIYFTDMATGLGSSNTTNYKTNYQTFITALRANSTSSDDALALSGGRLPSSTTNPVNGTTTINLKTATIKALGISGSFPPSSSGGYDGIVRLNTAITDTDGGTFSLFATVEHEIDEVLGLGSDLPSSTAFFTDPAPEDLFRYASTANVRSFSANASCTSPPQAFFSIDGTAKVNEFHNCSDGNDYGDWITHTPSQVQDAATNGTGSPSLDLNSPETRALDVIGYHLAPPPTTVTVGTNHAGFQFNVDGTFYTSTQMLSFAQGSSVAVDTLSPQTAAGGVQYAFQNWSDGLARAHSLIVGSSPMTVTANFAVTGPAVTINQAAGQPDPTSASPINFTVVFSEAVTGFTSAGVTLGSAVGGTSATVSGSGTTYNVAVSGMKGSGPVVATVLAGAASGIAFGISNVASTSMDNTVTFVLPGGVNVMVPGTADIWLAGGASLGCPPGCDVAPTNSPVLASNGLPLTSGAILTISATWGTNYGGCANLSPDGGCGGILSATSPNSLSGITAPINALIGVFLNDNPPAGSSPVTLNFSTVAAQGAATISPLLNQVFFIGDGSIGTGSLTAQGFTVPEFATRLFLASADTPGNNYNNTGSFNVTLSIGPLEITSAAATTFRVGLAGATFQVTASGSPAPEITESGPLPNGISFAPGFGFGTLSGTPASGTAGTYPIFFTAHNGVGSDVSQFFTLTITSGGTVSFSITVPGKADIWLAGQPNGAVLVSDTAPTNSPVLGSSGLNLANGSFLTILATGGTNYGGCGNSSPDGGCGGDLTVVSPVFNISGNSLSGVTVPINALIGIFLDNNVPGASQPPAALNFTSVAARGARTISPLLNQVFFIGDGLMGTGSLRAQQFIVPPGATRLFLGSADTPGGNYNNAGSFTVSVSVGAMAITSAPITTFRVGTAETFTVTATGSPTLSASGVLPSGVTFNAATGVMSGTPASGTAGTYPLIFTAHSRVGDVTQNFTLTVTSAGTVSSVITVSGKADIWLAGQPDGATLGNDSAPIHGAAFASSGLNLSGGSTLTISAAGGTSYGGCADSSPDGGCGGNLTVVSPVFNSPGNSLSGITVPINALIGIFLDNNVPRSGQPPAALNFSTAGAQAAGTISPVLNQVFFIGDGLTGTGTGTAQQFSVPAFATRLLLGSADNLGNNSDNSGSFNVTVSLTGTAATIAPAVTIDLAAGQADPTGISPINFAVVFSEVVTGFTNSDVTLGGTAPFGTKAVVVTGSGTTYNVAASGMTGPGTVIVTIAAGVATGTVSGLTNVASTATDNNTVSFTGPGPKKVRGQLISD